MSNLATELKFKKWIETCKRLGIGITEDMSEMSLDDTFRVLGEMEQRIKELKTQQWAPVPNQFEYEGKQRGNPRWLTVHTIDNSGVSYLILESPEDGEAVAIELPSSLSLCQKVKP